MGWFEEQIEQRRRSDRQMLEDSFVKVAGAVLGQRKAEKIGDRHIVAKNAVDEILKYYHLRPAELPDGVRDIEEQLDLCLRPHGLMRRTVELTEGWYRDACGPVLAFMKQDRIPAALLPGTLGGYTFTDPRTGRREKLNAGNAPLFETEAICFYRPLPQRALGIPDLLLYMKRCVSLSDMVLLVAATLAVTLAGMVMPRLIRLLTGPVLSSGRADALAGAAVSMVCVAFSAWLLKSSRELLQARLNIKTSLGVQSSMMMRLLNLPAGFFRSFSAGELKSRAMQVNRLCTLLLGMVMSAVLTSVSSLLYVTQIFRFAPALTVPALVILLVTAVVSAASTVLRVRIDRQQMELGAKESGLSYSLITGVQKIRLAGAEQRAFAKWLDLYADSARLRYDPPVLLRLGGVISTAITLFSNIVLYYLAVKARVEPSAYYAFIASYGMVMGAFLSVSEIAMSAAQIRPILEMAEPFLKTAPETAEGREIVTGITGEIELDHVSFRYNKDMPYVLDDLSLKIRPGEYVAVVGKSGCGKSTLLRLLLGFEKPEKGAVFFDGKDIGSLDLPSLRRRIGTVTQDAGLFQGDIYSNIVITAPELGLDDAWAAAETAGIADDIRAMPMGMHTVIGEGQGGISGGQRQRIMIARAVAPRPRLLMFDEATSALDNRTQRQVSEALDAMGCTRLVIAHRLSTIRHCGRILVLDGGRIAEEGTYEELIAKNGLFAELVERQRLDTAG